MAVDAKTVIERYERGGKLTPDELRFLQDRGVKVEPVPVTFNMPNSGGTVSNDPMAVIANIEEQRRVDIEDEVERRVEVELARRLAGSAVMDDQHARVVSQTPHTGTANSNVRVNPDPEEVAGRDEQEEGPDEEGPDYEEGWNNDERRAELARRGLSIEGKKTELIDRLKRADDGKLSENDAASADDDDEEEES